MSVKIANKISEMQQTCYFFQQLDRANPYKYIYIVVFKSQG